MAKQHNIHFLETSAKTNVNVEQAFVDLSQAILHKMNKVRPPLILCYEALYFRCNGGVIKSHILPFCCCITNVKQRHEYQKALFYFQQ